MVQIKGFWAKHDPAQAAAGPGSCIGKGPEPIPGIPATATKPDCQTPAGCLFCVNQRDIDSLDHIWSLASYRWLKSYELAAHQQPESMKTLPTHPAELAIDRLSAKLAYILSSSPKRETWGSGGALAHRGRALSPGLGGDDRSGADRECRP